MRTKKQELWHFLDIEFCCPSCIPTLHRWKTYSYVVPRHGWSIWLPRRVTGWWDVITKPQGGARMHCTCAIWRKSAETAVMLWLRRLHITWAKESLLKLRRKSSGQPRFRVKITVLMKEYAMWSVVISTWWCCAVFGVLEQQRSWNADSVGVCGANLLGDTYPFFVCSFSAVGISLYSKASCSHKASYHESPPASHDFVHTKCTPEDWPSIGRSCPAPCSNSGLWY